MMFWSLNYMDHDFMAWICRKKIMCWSFSINCNRQLFLKPSCLYNLLITFYFQMRRQTAWKEKRLLRPMVWSNIHLQNQIIKWHTIYSVMWKRDINCEQCRPRPATASSMQHLLRICTVCNGKGQNLIGPARSSIYLKFDWFL